MEKRHSLMTWGSLWEKYEVGFCLHSTMYLALCIHRNKLLLGQLLPRWLLRSPGCGCSCSCLSTLSLRTTLLLESGTVDSIEFIKVPLLKFYMAWLSESFLWWQEVQVPTPSSRGWRFTDCVLWVNGGGTCSLVTVYFATQLNILTLKTFILMEERKTAPIGHSGSFGNSPS